jgi:hypothetical protein
VSEVSTHFGETLLQPAMLSGRGPTALRTSEGMPALRCPRPIPEEACSCLPHLDRDQFRPTTRLRADQVAQGKFVVPVHELPIVVVIDPERVGTLHIAAHRMLLRSLGMVPVIHRPIVAAVSDTGDAGAWS